MQISLDLEKYKQIGRGEEKRKEQKNNKDKKRKELQDILIPKSTCSDFREHVKRIRRDSRETDSKVHEK